jgi:hypothetical protein
MTIPVASIKQQKDIGSLMPTGLADSMTHQEFIDLIRFLSELGRPGLYGPDTAMVVRRWRVLDPAPTVEPTGDLPASIAADSAGWQPAYALVSGELPASAFAHEHGKNVSWARADLDVTAAGPVRILLNDAKGVELWVNGKRAEAKADLTLDLPTGIATLVFKLDVAQRGQEGIRAEVQDIAGSKGHAQPVGGK